MKSCPAQPSALWGKFCSDASSLLPPQVRATVKGPCLERYFSPLHVHVYILGRYFQAPRMRHRTFPSHRYHFCIDSWSNEKCGQLETSFEATCIASTLSEIKDLNEPWVIVRFETYSKGILWIFQHEYHIGMRSGRQSWLIANAQVARPSQEWDGGHLMLV